MLRLITEGKVNPEEAVRAYHGVLQAKGIKPKLPLEKDLEHTDQAMSYEGSARRSGTVNIQNNPLGRTTSGNSDSAAQEKGEGSPDWPVLPGGAPDFNKMNSQQRRAYDRNRLSQRFG
jgi:hypothetical protein